MPAPSRSKVGETNPEPRRYARRLGGVSHHTFRPANAGLLGQQTAWHMLATPQAISHPHRRGPRAFVADRLPVLGFSYDPCFPLRLVANRKAKADEDCRGQHVPKDLRVVRFHLLLSFLLGRPLSGGRLLFGLIPTSQEAYGGRCPAVMSVASRLGREPLSRIVPAAPRSSSSTTSRPGRDPAPMTAGHPSL